MKRYFSIWLKMTSNSFQTIIASRFSVVCFIFAKLFRLGFYLVFIFFLFSQVKNIVGFNKNETFLFLTSFIFLGSLGQMCFREAYRFRSRLVSGEFDFDLARPIHPLFKNLAGGFDFLDLFTMPIIIYILVKTIALSNFTLLNLGTYILLLTNAFLILMAIHVFVMGFGIITTEVDNAIMVYRDIETMGRFPVDIYKEPLRQILTFVIPVGLMFTFPVRALLGLLSWQAITISLFIGILFVYLSFCFWNFAVKRYSSASS